MSEKEWTEEDELEAWTKYAEEVEAHNKAFLERWPNACQSCLASGEVHWSENAAPWGSGENWPMQMSDICSACLSNGKCPRCGKATFEDEEDFEDLECSACGWKPSAEGLRDL